ncbi:hypothetical protein [Pararcticibacter amylolyticus]|nr:hypothetical protein [Pararcticibacter amylolyticus]
MPPVLMINGTADPIIPYEGGRVKFFGRSLGNVISALGTAEIFVESHDGAKTTQTIRFQHIHPDDLTSVERRIWLQDQHELVSLLTVHGGGHVVPQSIAKFPKLMGKVNLDFSAPREAVNFWRLTGG